MNPQEVSWIDVVSPIITFALVIVLPSAVALWVIYRTLTDPSGGGEVDEDAAPDEAQTE